MWVTRCLPTPYKGIKNNKMLKSTFITPLKTMTYTLGLAKPEIMVILYIEIRETL